jgi:basic amino acid/polyamine antiporter, APA family
MALEGVERWFDVGVNPPVRWRSRGCRAGTSHRVEQPTSGRQREWWPQPNKEVVLMAVPSGGGVAGSAGLDSGAFARRATGLTRELPARSTFFYNWLSIFPPIALAVGIFYALSAFPGGNLYVAYLLAFVIGVPINIAIGMLSSTMPRSGGDWILVTRVLGPYVGAVSTFFALATFAFAAAFIALATVTQAVGPSLAAIGLVTNNQSLTNLAGNILGSHTWTFVVALVALLAAGVLAGLGWRVSLRIFNWGTYLAIAGLVLAGLVVLVVSGASFVSAFNHFAQPVTNNPDSYHQIITSAQKAGVDTNPPFSWAATWPTLGAVLSTTIYAYVSIYVGGEVRRGAAIRTPVIMLGVLAATFAFLAAYTALFYSSFGKDFFTAINAISGSKDYPFSAPPYYVFLAAIAGQNGLLAWILGLTFLISYPLLLFVIVIQPVRVLFALAFDGLLPSRMADVSERWHVPQWALVVSLVGITAVLAWAVLNEFFFTVLAYTVLFQTTSMFLLCLSAALLPFRRKELWRGGTAAWTWGNVPVITVAGIGGMIGLAIVWLIFMSYEGLGIANRGQAVFTWAAVGLLGLVFFLVARAVRSRGGQSVTFSEIPPE